MGRKKAKQTRVRLPEKIQSFIYQARYGRSLKYPEIVSEAKKKFPKEKEHITEARCKYVINNIRQKMRKNSTKKTIRRASTYVPKKTCKNIKITIEGAGTEFTDNITFKDAKKIIMNLVFGEKL